MTTDCIFCKIGNGEVESDILYRGDVCFVIRDIIPKAPTHLLVIPNEHVTFVSTMDLRHEHTVGEMLRIAHKAADLEAVASTGYRLVINQGSNAGQAVDHLHMHLLAGRPLGDMG